MSNLEWCISYLKQYNHGVGFDLPLEDEFRALMNITMPIDLSDEYYLRQDLALKEIYQKRKIIDVNELKPIKDKIYLYQGDITNLKVDAITNACNEKLLGCFSPLHNCVDNAIHSFAGLEVRRDLLEVMTKQGHDERNGLAKITKGYNLPSSYIIHTVGPIVNGYVTRANREDLMNCYLSSLRMADQYNLKSIAFCSISTGIYGYPIEKAVKVALNAVNYYLKEENKNLEKVVFCLFSKRDYDVYYRTIKEED